MSAWDIAGAVVWTLLTIMFFNGAVEQKRDGENATATAIAMLVFMTAAVFCFARIFGAK